jgi:hypothetical protein
VFDDERYAKEIMDLKLTLKTIYKQNLDIDSRIKQVESQKRDKEADFDRVTIEKRSVYNNRSQKVE